jgi:hypothetical protein
LLQAQSARMKKKWVILLLLILVLLIVSVFLLLLRATCETNTSPPWHSESNYDLFGEPSEISCLGEDGERVYFKRGANNLTCEIRLKEEAELIIEVKDIKALLNDDMINASEWIKPKRWGGVVQANKTTIAEFQFEIPQDIDEKGFKILLESTNKDTGRVQTSTLYIELKKKSWSRDSYDWFCDI